MRRHLPGLLALCGTSLLLWYIFSPAPPTQIPLSTLVAPATHSQVKLSPNGKYISWLGPVGPEGTLQIWVAPLTSISSARPITTLSDAHSIDSYYWTYTNTDLAYSADTDGNELFQSYLVDLAGHQTLLSPPSSDSFLHPPSYVQPSRLLLDYDHTLYQFDITTHSTQPVFSHLDYDHIYPNLQQTALLGLTSTATDELQMWYHSPTTKSLITTIPSNLSFFTNPLGFDDSGNNIIATASLIGETTTQLYSLSPQTKHFSALTTNPNLDVDTILLHPQTRLPQAVTFTSDRQLWHILDSKLESDMSFLRTHHTGELAISDRTLDTKLWVVSYTTDASPQDYFLYQPAHHQLTHLFSSYPQLANYRFAKTSYHTIPTPNQIDIPVYVTKPLDTSPPYPTVLLIHGGPHDRDYWDFDIDRQWLANRGYLVIQVQYGGSTGFGTKFATQPTEMTTHLHTVTAWAVKSGLADKNHIAPVGTSYGGLATLSLLSQYPNEYAAGISQSPVSLPDFSHINRITRPLLLISGQNDPRAPITQANLLAQSLPASVLKQHLVFPNQGHVITKLSNQLVLYSTSEKFLAKYLLLHD